MGETVVLRRVFKVVSYRNSSGINPGIEGKTIEILPVHHFCTTVSLAMDIRPGFNSDK